MTPEEFFYSHESNQVSEGLVNTMINMLRVGETESSILYNLDMKNIYITTDIIGAIRYAKQVLFN